ncbi:MAG: helicase [Verrucomicrobia bacterium GWC2_42_7]|nr:MAG: helicase [Verrucomicrobia bacterium GWC2_42_7]
MVNIIRGTSQKPISSQRLANFFSHQSNYDGYLFIGYPIIGTTEGPYPIDALWISKKNGLVIFNLVEGRDIAGYQEAQDDSANKLESKLRNHKPLMKSRSLLVPINVITFAPTLQTLPKVDNYSICNESNLNSYLNQLKWETSEVFEALVAVIQTISTIRKGRKKRVVQKEDSRGAKLKKLEDSIANLDNLQGQAVIETVEGVQRIRGLAGSGKTIVLALKAAYMHAIHPDWKIAVTFNTRSLKGQFRQFINTFVIEQTNEEPDWDNLHIIHAWGAPGGGERNGIYYSFCQTNSLECYDYATARAKFGPSMEFKGACDLALNQLEGTSNQLYDAILVDEAQDFPPSFLRLCYEILGTDKRLVYAYDELQNLSSQSLPAPEEIFGKNSDGSPCVRFTAYEPGKPQQDIILEKCYRNSRPVLASAHALGFGIYRKKDPEINTGLVQIFDQKQLWLDIGYSIVKGELNDGHEVTLARTDESSPAFLENHSSIEDLIQFHSFKTSEEQAEWLVNQIQLNLTNEELRSDDIVIINPDPVSTRSETGPIRKLLFDKNINSHLAGVDTSPDIFFHTDRDSIAFTGIYRAKGNEAGMVYIINAQDCYSAFGNLASIRNRLFTAITRSKAWVRVLGVGDRMKKLAEEFDQIKAHKFELTFRYPTHDERKHLNLVNRDMTADEKRRVQKGKGELGALLEDLESGKIYIEDLGSEQIRRLRSLINKDNQ